MGGVDEWLERLGLSRYRAVFAEHDIDREILPDLTDQDLEKLGLSLGHRKKLLRAIAELSRGEAVRTVEAAPRAAERRQLSVLFCDLVGSTELAARLDPEDLRAVMRAYQAACADVIGRFEGHVAKYLGDGVLAYFGWPRVHEDDAERAVRAGLALVEAVSRLESTTHQQLRARVGIATGQAVVGDLVGEGASREEAVVGDVPNLAARLQALAEPQSVVVSQATRRLLGGVFDLDDLGAQRLKGFAEPLAAWRVAGESRAEGRFEARQSARLTPLVGREEELALLLRRWEQARDGEGQVVLLSGEPGIGKSRLVREVRARLEAEPHVRLLFQCSPHHTTSPLHPLIEQLERAAGFARDDGAEERLDKLETLLARGTAKLDAAVPLVAALLGMPTGERYPLPEMTPQRQKQLTLEVLVDQLAGLAAAEPVLLAYEDVHWIDPTTQELLGLAIERIRGLSALLLITFRPEFTPPWSGQPHVSALALTRLGRREGSAMVERVVRDKALPPEVAAQIVAKTDGVPLFVEELTKTVLESGLLADAGDHYELSGPLPPLAIPASLHDSLMARLDRLAAVKEIAQIGAAIGREFPHALLAAVAERPEPELQSALDQLVSSELVFRRGTPPDATYTFKHALVQDAAYGTLLKSRRQHLHARIAHALEGQFPDQVEAQPELLAHHCTEGGLRDKAVGYWYEAGRLALGRSAMVEAVAHLTYGLDVLANSADRFSRQAYWEVKLRVAVGSALAAAHGTGSPKTGQAYARAVELCDQAGDSSLLFPALYGLVRYHFSRAELVPALELAERALDAAQREDDLSAQLAGRFALGSVSLALGRLPAARAHLEQALALSNCTTPGAVLGAYGVDLRAISLAYLSWTVFILGYADRASDLSRQALEEAKSSAHPMTLCAVLDRAITVAQFCRELSTVADLVDQMISLAKEQVFLAYIATGEFCRGWMSNERECSIEAVALMRAAMATLEDNLDEDFVPLCLAQLAAAHARAGSGPDALSLVRSGLTRVARTGERLFEPELHRVEGEVLLSSPPRNDAAAQACFRRAIAIAREQAAKSWELRAATSLARLWRDQGRRAEAHDLLAPVYGWFSEGFETPDLKHAKALLDELA